MEKADQVMKESFETTSHVRSMSKEFGINDFGESLLNRLIDEQKPQPKPKLPRRSFTCLNVIGSKPSRNDKVNGAQVTKSQS